MLTFHVPLFTVLTAPQTSGVALNAHKCAKLGILAWRLTGAHSAEAPWPLKGAILRLNRSILFPSLCQTESFWTMMQESSDLDKFFAWTQTLLVFCAQPLEQNSRPPTSRALVWVTNIPQFWHRIICAGRLFPVATRGFWGRAGKRSRRAKRIARYARRQ